MLSEACALEAHVKCPLGNSTFNTQHSTLNIQHSKLNIQHSTLNTQHLKNKGDGKQ